MDWEAKNRSEFVDKRDRRLLGIMVKDRLSPYSSIKAMPMEELDTKYVILLDERFDTRSAINVLYVHFSSDKVSREAMVVTIDKIEYLELLESVLKDLIVEIDDERTKRRLTIKDFNPDYLVGRLMGEKNPNKDQSGLGKNSG